MRRGIKRHLRRNPGGRTIVVTGMDHRAKGPVWLIAIVMASRANQAIAAASARYFVSSADGGGSPRVLTE